MFDLIDLLINNTKIPTVKVFKDLGIYITENFKWNEHIIYLINVTQVSSYQISKSLKNNSAILTKLFKIYFRPKLEYNTQVWSPYLKKTLTKLSLCKEVLPVLYVFDVTYPIHYTILDWLNLD